jgi:hypothetical protein
MEAGTLNVPANASRVVTPTLPSFSSAKSSHANDRRPALASDAGETTRRHRELDVRYQLQRHAQTVAQATARGRALGNLTVTLFVALAVCMAGYTLNAERHQQQQLQERIR